MYVEMHYLHIYQYVNNAFLPKEYADTAWFTNYGWHLIHFMQSSFPFLEG